MHLQNMKFLPRAARAIFTGNNRFIHNITIIGKGFAGLKITEELVAGLSKGEKFHITTIEQRSTLGGAAYATPHNTATLNVAVEKIGSDAANKSNFQDYITSNIEQLRADYPQIDKFATKGSFPPRKLYQSFLQQKFSTTQELARQKNISLESLTGEVIDSIPQPVNHYRFQPQQLILRDGRTITTDAVALCLGNTPPPPIEMQNNPSITDTRIIQDPLLHENFGIEPEKLLHAAQGKKIHILLRGFGLTAVDIAIALDVELREKHGAEIEITALQRGNTGILKHPTTPQDFSGKRFMAARNADELWKMLQTALHEESAFRPEDCIGVAHHMLSNPKSSATYAPQDIADGLRTVFNAIWAKFPPEEQQKWLKDYHSHYRFIRNRVTRETGDYIEGMITRGTLTLVTGRLHPILSNGENKPLHLTITDRTGTLQHLTCDAVFNAVGPRRDLESSPLLQNLRQRNITPEAVVGGFTFAEKTAFVSTIKNGPLIIACSHDQARYIENSGIKEKRETVKTTAQEIITRRKELLGTLPDHSNGLSR